MPTIRGLRRRGYPAAALRAFTEHISVAKTNSVVDMTSYSLLPSINVPIVKAFITEDNLLNITGAAKIGAMQNVHLVSDKGLSNFAKTEGLVLSVLGISALNSTLMQEKMVSNTKDLNIAFQAAEAGLRDAEDARGEHRIGLQEPPHLGIKAAEITALGVKELLKHWHETVVGREHPEREHVAHGEDGRGARSTREQVEGGGSARVGAVRGGVDDRDAHGHDLAVVHQGDAFLRAGDDDDAAWVGGEI